MGNLTDHLTGVANAIRTMKGTSASIPAGNFANEIKSIQANTNDATATAATIRSGYTAYAGGSKITGTLATYSGPQTISPGPSSQTLPTAGKYMGGNITVIPAQPGVDTSDATASPSNILSGYTAYARGGKMTGAMPMYTGATSVTPSASAQTLITAGRYLSSNISISGTTQLSSFKSGQCTSSNNIITINCGFKPDYLIYTFTSNGVGYIGYTTSPTVTYTTQSTNSDTLNTNSSISRTSTGATITSRTKNNNAFPTTNVAVTWLAFGGIT